MRTTRAVRGRSRSGPRGATRPWPSDVESREFFNGYHKQVGEKREDISTWADVLDLDDYVTFGGKA